ncbi:unnamed protein product [Parnassius apollo]|uniref:(apollo) hypothetical protein n=1 Tax=Parnassius apollo TaxID=110799 RepID=A0A8S3WM85_PARAO|nr:unnamed protein product [Parnassius apollo]
MGKRRWDRRNACFYCQELVTNFSRHLLRKHPNEIEVIKYKSINDVDLKVRKQKRQEITDKLRNKGNFIHNSKVCFDRDGEKTIIPAKRNTQESSPSASATCKTCLGTFKRSTFFRHFKKFGAGANDHLTLGCRKRVLYNNSITIIPKSETASIELRDKILPHLRSDEFSLVVKNDPLILAYGSRLLKKKKERLPMQVLQKAVVGTQLIEYENTIRSHNKIETVTSQSENIIGKQENENPISEFENTNTSQINLNKLEMITSQFENFIEDQNNDSSHSCKNELSSDATENLKRDGKDFKVISNATVDSNNATNYLEVLSENINIDSGKRSAFPENQKLNHQMKNKEHVKLIENIKKDNKETECKYIKLKTINVEEAHENKKIKVINNKNVKQGNQFESKKSTKFVKRNQVQVSTQTSLFSDSDQNIEANRDSDLEKLKRSEKTRTAKVSTITKCEKKGKLKKKEV